MCLNKTILEKLQEGHHAGNRRADMRENQTKTRTLSFPSADSEQVDQYYSIHMVRSDKVSVDNFILHL